MRILVYGSRKSVWAIARFLESELPIETEKLISAMEFEGACSAEIDEGTENELRDKIGRYDVIVLADPINALKMNERLNRKYPKQKFVGYGWGLARMIKKYRTIFILASREVRRTEEYQKMKAECQGVEIMESDGGGWIELIRGKCPTKEEIMERVKSACGAPILVLHQGLPWNEVREIVDWRGEVVDMEEQILAGIKAELGLKIS